MTSFESIEILAQNTNDTNLQLLDLVTMLEPNYGRIKELAENYRSLTNIFSHKLNEKEQELLFNCNDLFDNMANYQQKIFETFVLFQKEQLEKTKIAVDIYEYAIDNFK